MRAKHSKDISINRFAYNGREFEYELERNRVKNINVRIKPERIYVSADYTVPLEYIERFLLSKGDYIFRALEKYNEGKYPPMRGTYEEGDIIYILGQRYVLNLEKGKNGARIEEKRLFYPVYRPASMRSGGELWKNGSGKAASVYFRGLWRQFILLLRFTACVFRGYI